MHFSAFLNSFARLLVLCTLMLGSAIALAAKPLIVGHTSDYEPLNFVRDGKLVGIEIDNAREIGKILDRPVKAVIMPFEDLLKALDSGDIDVVMAGVSVTPERQQRVTFVEPFMTVGQMAIILADKAGRFAQPRAIYQEGIRIGVEPFTTGERYVQDTLNGAKVSHFPTSEAAFAALRSNQIDMYIHDAPTSWLLAVGTANSDLLSLFRYLSSEDLAWAVRKDNTRLAAELNMAIQVLKDNGRLRAIQNRWIPIQVNVR
ncbi:amino acid ABC transporter substrate-binding protein [Halieaceae bacterium IMCC14734]|uniref:Amino acid ABC transporter substrate-binding protein n=1 Tax=Candidatus Litorirhabdus singularis TaxID=2518993 RepID=A0ABT3TMW6_9GAMM|nr:ABC transporter substrate-binding protein [Candidatus Litorirhabdus singularis]MCX2983105.1 amino acid ABC transporter substrate-binding protein [Candidatus Litorirhabdus singularis]